MKLSTQVGAVVIHASRVLDSYNNIWICVFLGFFFWFCFCFGFVFVCFLYPYKYHNMDLWNQTCSSILPAGFAW